MLREKKVFRMSKLTTVRSSIPMPARLAFFLIAATPLASRGNDRFLRPEMLPSLSRRRISTEGTGHEVISDPVKYFPRHVSVVSNLSMAWRAFGVVIVIVVQLLCGRTMTTDNTDRVRRERVASPLC